MTIINRNPVNQNKLAPNKFVLNFSRLPNMQFWVQSATVPGISLSEIPATNPFVDIYSPGEKAIYDLLTVTFIVDEDIQSWKEIHDWIRGMTFPKEYKEYRDLFQQSKFSLSKPQFPQFSDASLTLLTSSNKPNYRFKFYDVFPTSLSTFIMNTQDGPENVITADATFRYMYYDIDDIA